MKKIKHVYFDVGGVTILDFSGTDKWMQLKRDLGISDDQDEIFEAVWKKYRPRICLDCDIDQIISDFETALQKKFPEGYSMLKDFVNRFEKNPSIWPVIELAKKRYNIGLITNMYPRMLNSIRTAGLLPEIEWDVIVDSSQVGFKKPDENIYRLAEEMAGVAPESIFFIDNKEEFVEGARKRNWQTMIYNPQEPELSSKKVAEKLKLSL